MVRASTLADGISGVFCRPKHELGTICSKQTQYFGSEMSTVVVLEATCSRMHAAADDHFGASYVSQSDQWKNIWGFMIGLQQAPKGSRIWPGGGLDVII